MSRQKDLRFTDEAPTEALWPTFPDTARRQVAATYAELMVRAVKARRDSGRKEAHQTTCVKEEK